MPPPNVDPPTAIGDPTHATDTPSPEIYYQPDGSGKSSDIVDGHGTVLKRRVGRPETLLCPLKRPTGPFWNSQAWQQLKKTYQSANDDTKRQLEEEYGLNCLIPDLGTPIEQVCMYLDFNLCKNHVFRSQRWRVR